MKTSICKQMTSTLLKFSVLLSISFFIFSSCENDDDTVSPDLPVTIDYHQVVGQDSLNGATGFSYTQDGLTVQTMEGTSYNAEAIGRFWLYPGQLKISNIHTLKGLTKISFDWYANNTSSLATLYDKSGQVIEAKSKSSNEQSAGKFEFTTGLENASYLIIEGLENTYSSIVFE